MAGRADPRKPSGSHASTPALENLRSAIARSGALPCVRLGRYVGGLTVTT